MPPKKNTFLCVFRASTCIVLKEIELKYTQILQFYSIKYVSGVAPPDKKQPAVSLWRPSVADAPRV